MHTGLLAVCEFNTSTLKRAAKLNASVLAAS
jgi:hypothetical protein